MLVQRHFFLSILFVLFYKASLAQNFKVGSVEVYGNRKIATGTVLGHLTIKAGDSIAAANFNRDAIIATLKKIAGVKYATINPVCCDTSGNMMLFIGIGETSDVILKLRTAPTADIQLPQEAITAYRNFSIQLDSAMQNRQGTEDDSNGYALMNYPPARYEQNKFVGIAGKYFTQLVKVLHYSKYAEQRAAAAQIIAYAANRKMVVAQLLFAADDPDEETRNNAVRALGILGGYASLHPGENIIIPSGPFIKMLNSIVWTDRNKGAGVLLQLTQSRNLKLLQEIKQYALPSIIEMAKWQDRSHAIYSFFILGRIAGVSEEKLSAHYDSPGWPEMVNAMEKKCSR